MTAESKNSVRISGSGSAGGGVYESVSISGSGKITGDVEAEEIKISGAATIHGSARAKSFRASGSFEVEGGLEAGELRCSGSGKIAGSVKVDLLRSSGALKVEGGVKTREARISGAGKFGADVEAERFRSSGAFNIAGLLSADSVEIALGNDCQAREIGGEQITVVQARGGRGILGINWNPRSWVLSAESIEGDDLHLEGTHARVVRGRRVKLGPGCRVESVEYSESLHIDPDAEVTQHTYTGGGTPPPVVQGPLVPPSISGRGGGVRSCAVRLGGWEVRNPIARLIVATCGLLFAAVVVGAVLFVVLPAVGLLVSLVLGGVAVLLLVLAIGLPVIVVGALAIKALLFPFALISSRCRRRGRSIAPRA